MYKDVSGRYSYAKPIEGTFHDARVRTPIPKDTKLVGDIHSHDDYSRAVTDEHGKPVGIERIPRTDPNFRRDSFKSDHPSPKDEQFWHKAGQGKKEYKGYLTTPSGQMWRQDGVDQKSQPVEMSPRQQQQQQQRQQQFQSPGTLFFIQIIH
jgi:hypothetical protein